MSRETRVFPPLPITARFAPGIEDAHLDLLAKPIRDCEVRRRHIRRERSPSLVSGKRSIGKEQAKKLAEFCHIRADLFI
jgi:hypothetical protein